MARQPCRLRCLSSIRFRPTSNDSASDLNMSHANLCRERLDRIQRVLARSAGALSERDFTRSFSVWKWEIEQAAALGVIKIETHKPCTGRPSRIVRSVSQSQAAKLPPSRASIPSTISVRHWNFALYSVCRSIKGGRRSIFHLPPYTDAYLSAFPAAKKRRAATASMSRLLRHPDVKAARAWFYARVNYEIPKSEPMPTTAQGIWQRLRELGSWRTP